MGVAFMPEFFGVICGSINNTGRNLTFALAIYLQNSVAVLTELMTKEQEEERSVARKGAMKSVSWQKNEIRLIAFDKLKRNDMLKTFISNSNDSGRGLFHNNILVVRQCMQVINDLIPGKTLTGNNLIWQNVTH
jgi:hypothetical protein